MKIILSGGGTIGPVTPLIAIAEELKQAEAKAKEPSLDILWLGTKQGPEQALVSQYGYAFEPIIWGKWRRYFSLLNLLTPFLVIIGFIQSFFKILKFKPDIIISVGGFVAVPVVWAGYILRCKVLIHQQDIRPGLANKLCASTADMITVTFKDSVKYFPADKTKWLGNPVRPEFDNLEQDKAKQALGLKTDKPVLLFTGGGTGAAELNKLIRQAALNLSQYYQIIHLTGQGKKMDLSLPVAQQANYQAYEFLTDKMKLAMAAADLIVARAGLATFSEIAYLNKPSLLIPMPHSHQEDNAKFFEKAGVTKALSQLDLTAKRLEQAIDWAMDDQAWHTALPKKLSALMKDQARQNMAQLIRDLVKSQ